MGACCQPSDPNSSYIDSKMKENEMYEKSLNKLLFLGPGGSGKSTIFKQLQWLHGTGFSGGDIEELKQHINGQIISQMKSAIRHYLHEPLQDDDELQSAINTVKAHHNLQELTKEIADCISYIWQNDDRLKGIFDTHPSKKILEESTQHFWDSLERIAADDFVPTKADIINIRNRTTGIIEKKFTLKNCNFHIFDVGGQKSERKKWFKCFDNVKAVVFVVSICSYNEMMFEDETRNCMVDALELFEQTINNEMFCDTNIILFLNKKDLFEDKIKDLALTVSPAFDDFNGDPHDFNQTTGFIASKFEKMNKKKREIYTHLTCAMDDKNVEAVFADIARIMLEDLKRTMGRAHIL